MKYVIEKNGKDMKLVYYSVNMVGLGVEPKNGVPGLTIKAKRVVLVDPELRDAYIKQRINKKIDINEPVVVCPVDPYVNDDYFEALKKLSEQADKGEANLVLMGIEPTYPSEKYGYIIPEGKEEASIVIWSLEIIEL